MSETSSGERRTFTVVFRSSGPITRSTLPEADADPVRIALDDALHWVWSCQLQMTRLLQSIHHERRNAYEDRMSMRRAFSSTSYDEHILLVAGANLLRALDRGKAHLPPNALPLKTRRALDLLRNIYEHWDEQRDAFRLLALEKTKSGKSFIEEFPDGKPWSTKYYENCVLLGGVLDLVVFQEGLGDLEVILITHESFLKGTAREETSR